MCDGRWGQGSYGKARCAIGVAQMKRVCGRARCARGVAQIYESRVVGARMCDRGHSKWTHHNPREGSLKMGSDALKATILDRGHSTEASRGVEHQFAAPRSSRKQPDTGARGGTRGHAGARGSTRKHAKAPGAGPQAFSSSPARSPPAVHAAKGRQRDGSRRTPLCGHILPFLPP